MAQWLTTFPDEQLTCLFDDVQHYATKYLSPVTADYHFYTEMDDSICHGLGELTLGDEEEAPRIYFPDEVEIVTEYKFPILSPILEVDVASPLVTDPAQDEIETENVIIGIGLVGLSTDGINLVASPELPGDLAPKGYTDTNITDHIFSVDDGLY